MENEIIEKILGVDIKVTTDKGEERIISISDLIDIDNKNTSLSVDKTFYSKPRCKINLHIECDGYSFKISESR